MFLVNNKISKITKEKLIKSNFKFKLKTKWQCKVESIYLVERYTGLY